MSMRKNNVDLKRPDLQGDFHCTSCNRLFKHRTSLNRHRQKLHGDEHTCLVCDTKKLCQFESVSDHMRNCHNLYQVFTCGCCNWTFAEKKHLIVHQRCMQRSGTVGEVYPIATSENVPGSLLQSATAKTEKSLKRKHIQQVGQVLSPQTRQPSGSTEFYEISKSATSADMTEQIGTEEKRQFSTAFNNAVDVILNSECFSGEKLTQLDTWAEIVNLANLMVLRYTENNENNMVHNENTDNEPMAKRVKLE